MGNGYFVAAREVVEKSLKLLYGFDGAGLVELRVGRVEIVAVACVEAGQLGVLAFGVACVILLEICAGGLVVLVFVVGESEQEESVFGFLGAFEYLGYVFECCCGLSVFFSSNARLAKSRR